MEDKTKMLLVASLMAGLIASSVNGESVVETFESAEPAASVATLTSAVWSGDGVVSTGESLSSSGFNALIESRTNTKVVAVEGEISCEKTTTATSSSQIDFLVNTEEGFDELPLPSEMEDAQFAVAFLENGDDSNMALKLLCSTNGVADWVHIGTAPKSSWVRFTAVIDHTNNRFLLSKDGFPCQSEFGFTVASAEGQAGGAWYDVVKASESKVSQVVFMGALKLDDFVLTQKDITDYSPYSPTAIAQAKVGEVDANLTFNEMQSLGVSVVESATPTRDGTGYTVGQKLLAGYAMNDKKKLSPSAMKVSTDAETDEQLVKIQVPAIANGRSTPNYSLVLSGQTDGEVPTNFSREVHARAVSNGEITFAMPNDVTLPRVLTFTVKAN